MWRARHDDKGRTTAAGERCRHEKSFVDRCTKEKRAVLREPLHAFAARPFWTVRADYCAGAGVAAMGVTSDKEDHRGKDRDAKMGGG